jgi:hypothetical protein
MVKQGMLARLRDTLAREQKPHFDEFLRRWRP